MLDRFRRLLPTVAIRTLSSLDAYTRWASTYPPRAHNVLMQTEESAMRSLLPNVSGLKVLDLACGTGRYARIARECGAASVVGLDNSLAMLQANSETQLGLATCEVLPLRDESFDVVICGLALGHLPQRVLIPALREMCRVLKKGGRALVSDFHPFVFLNGGQRTFTAPDGQTYAVEHYVHLYADYHRAAQQAGLWIEEVVESSVPLPSTGVDTPVVIAFRFAKPA
jgi:malonyl-CoA O-methyltransferase